MTWFRRKRSAELDEKLKEEVEQRQAYIRKELRNLGIPLDRLDLELDLLRDDRDARKR